MLIRPDVYVHEGPAWCHFDIQPEALASGSGQLEVEAIPRQTDDVSTRAIRVNAVLKSLPAPTDGILESFLYCCVAQTSADTRVCLADDFASDYRKCGCGNCEPNALPART